MGSSKQHSYTGNTSDQKKLKTSSVWEYYNRIKNDGVMKFVCQVPGCSREFSIMLNH